MWWFNRRRAVEAQQVLQGGDAVAAASVLLEAAGVAPTKGAAGLGMAGAQQAVREQLAGPHARPGFLLQYAPLARRLRLRAAGIREKEGRLSLAVLGPAEIVRQPLNGVLIARSVMYLVADALPAVQHVDLALFAQVRGMDRPVCFLSASAPRSRLRAVNPAALTPPQLAQVLDARGAQVDEEGMVPAEAHVAWDLE